jgi:NADH-quinone oxidoreductase subunit G
MKQVRAKKVAAGKGLVVSSWKQLLDNGTMQAGDKHLAATARPPVAKVGAAVFDAVGPTVTVTGDRGSITLPAEVAPDLVDGVVWLPANSTGAGLLTDLASPGSRVTVTGGNA